MWPVREVKSPPRKGSPMSAVEIECGKSHTEQRILSFTKADRDRIAQNFPDKIAVSVAGSASQEFPLRPYIAAILDQIQPPALKIAIAVRGEPDDLDTIEIDDIQLKVMGNTTGTFKIADVEISYAFDADILPGEMTAEPCECEHGGEGRQKSRTFKCTWEIEISIEPGIGGVYEIEEFEITVTSPCYCPDHEYDEVESEGDDDDDDDESGDDDRDGDDRDDDGKRKKSGKKKAKRRGK
jgi:hypothetical protein